MHVTCDTWLLVLLDSENVELMVTLSSCQQEQHERFRVIISVPVL